MAASKDITDNNFYTVVKKINCAEAVQLYTACQKCYTYNILLHVER